MQYASTSGVKSCLFYHDHLFVGNSTFQMMVKEHTILNLIGYFLSINQDWLLLVTLLVLNIFVLMEIQHTAFDLSEHLVSIATLQQ